MLNYCIIVLNETVKSYKLLKNTKPIPAFERVMAILATVNYGLVLFNFTYTTVRDYYFHYIPSLTQLYDPFKGIEPHQDTERYLQTVEELKKTVVNEGLNSPQSEEILEELRLQSEAIINENPFAIAEKTGTLEKIKNRMKARIINNDNSSTEAFNIFWSRPYLQQQGFNQELQWFDRTIKPLVASNYYRSLGENGELIRRFWKIDLPFMIIFGLEFLARPYLISRRYQKVSWLDAMFWRWYDAFLFLPFWQLLRIIPVLLRLDQVGFINLQYVRVQVTRGFVAGIAREITETVVVKLIEQVQVEIRQGDVVKRFLQGRQKQYLDINNINEIEAISNHLIQIIIYKVIPKVESDLEAVLRYNIDKAIQESPMNQFQYIPGLQQISEQIKETLITGLSNLATESPQNAYEAIQKGMADPVAVELSNQLVKNFTKLLGNELQKEQSFTEIQTLLIDFLEEFKLNYIQQVDEENYEQVLALLNEQRRLKEISNQ